MKPNQPEKLIVKGKRLDGRAFDEMRPTTSEVGVIKRALGSAVFKFENTYAIAGVYGPKPFHPKFMQDPQKLILRCKYTMVPFSTTERIRPGHSRRSTEISKVVTEALANVVFVEDYPRTGVDVFIEILQADASTRCAGLNAASMALADAGVPMRDLVSSCSVGRADGQILLDLFGLEDNYGDVDLAVATVGGQDKIVLLQMDGIITKDEFMTMLELAKKGCAEINEKQKEALRIKYETGELNDNE
ncbi:MAG: exosome complex exonuclease Rrp41 [Nanoarchaeota archaeon]|nr:exosome complex exonuclease Rrp41 [Nanoarchaeota archaeon]MBU4124518.1 exosome complex exonuclease Rrp41 [Nanoarchaeota archaeon]